jgi:hypothetical protein
MELQAHNKKSDQLDERPLRGALETDVEYQICRQDRTSKETSVVYKFSVVFAAFDSLSALA